MNDGHEYSSNGAQWFIIGILGVFTAVNFIQSYIKDSAKHKKFNLPLSVKWLNNAQGAPTFTMSVVDDKGVTNTIKIDVGLRSDSAVIWKTSE